MSLGHLGFSGVGNLKFPSPSIWGDCLNTVLNDKGLGHYVAQDFLGNYGLPATVTPAMIQSDADTGTTWLNASSATWGPNVLAILNTNTDNNAAEMHTTELGQIIRNSGNKVWAECRVAVGALGDSAFSFGFTTLANATRDVIADNPSNSARAALTAATFVGFVSKQTASALATVDAVYQKGSGTVVVVLADVTNATAFQAAQANLPSGTVVTQAAQVTSQATIYPPAYGIVTAYGNLVANAFRKFGIRFDGYTKLEFYVDGVLVARQEVDSTIDQAGFMVASFCQKTGAATQIINYVDFMNAGIQFAY